MAAVDRPPSSMDSSTRRVLWILIGAMLLSFVFGIAMFVPEENRAYTLEQTMAKYQARRREL